MPDNKSLWDDIQIEVSAEFKRVKMTLGELKQISKGLVIDLGPVINNEISLLVENKTVAKGELVIINDKYGVKVNEVFANKKADDQLPPPPKAEPQAHQPLPAQPQAVPHQAPPPPPRPAQRPAPPPPPKAAPQGGAKTPPPRPAQRPAPPRPAAKAAPQQGQNKEDFDYSNFEE